MPCERPGFDLWVGRWGTVAKKLPMRRLKRYKFNPWVGKIPWSRKWQPTAIFSPGKFHGQRSLAGYSLWGCEVKHLLRTPKNYWVYKNPCPNLTKWSWRTYLVFYWLLGVLCFFFFFFFWSTGRFESESEIAQSPPTLCNLMACSPPVSSVHGILQARILEWVAISFSRGSSQPRYWTQVSCSAGRCFNLWATRVWCYKSSGSLFHSFCR